MPKKIDYNDFRNLFIKFVNELSQNDFELVCSQVELRRIYNINEASNGANYAFRLAACYRREELNLKTGNERYWRDPFEKLIHKFVDALSEEDFQLLNEGIKNDTWGFARVNTWISNATNNRLSREKEINLPEMRNALTQLRMIGQELDQILIIIPSFSLLEEKRRMELRGLLRLSNENVISAENLLGTFLEKEEN